MKPRLLLLALCVACACKPSPQGTNAVKPATVSEPERLLLVYTSAFNRRALAEVLALLSEDVVVIGVDHCRGAPCFGRKGASDGYLELTLKIGFFRTNAWWKVEGDRVIAHYEAHPAFKMPRGAEHIRGIMTFTVRNGLITRIENSFRIDDPETVIVRNAVGDIVFGLRTTDTDEIAARVLVGKMGATTSIAVQLVDEIVKGQDLQAVLRDGTCKAPKASARTLQFVPGTWETRVDVAHEVLQSTPYHFELRRKDARIACGDFPVPKPDPPAPTE